MIFEPDFTCAICRREVCQRWGQRRGPDCTLPPFCRHCEQHYTSGVGKPAGGSFRDRREAMRLSAIAEALHSEAGIRQWGSDHAA